MTRIGQHVDRARVSAEWAQRARAVPRRAPLPPGDVTSSSTAMLAAPAEIPAFPVLIPLAVVGFLILMWSLRRRGSLTAPRAAVAVVLCVYAVAVFRSVLLPFPIVVGAARAELPPWQVFLQFVPVVTSLADPVGLALNLALFVPLGVLLVLLLREASALTVTAIGFLVSLGIEIVQFLADVTVSTGRVADIDDLLANTLGTLLGYAVCRLALRIRPVARLAAVARWPAGPRAAADRVPLP